MQQALIGDSLILLIVRSAVLSPDVHVSNSNMISGDALLGAEAD